MKCPYCNFEDTKVLESRCTDDGSKVRRRRECENCCRRFTTYETVEHVPLMVIKRDNSRQKFDKKKIFAGLLKACEKRPVSVDEIEDIVQHIERTLYSCLKHEIDSYIIGDICMKELRNKDEIAYIRFASVYRKFQDVHSFMEELKSFLDKKD